MASPAGGLIDMGVDQGFVRKAGAWYTGDGDHSARARRTPGSSFVDNPDLANELEKRIKEKLGVGPRMDAPADVPVEF